MSVAKSYARALFEAGRDQRLGAGDFVEMESQLSELAGLLKSSKVFRVALLSPTTSVRDKLSVLGAVGAKAGYSKLLSLFVALLARKGRLSLVEEMRGALAAIRLEAEGGVLAKLISAEGLEQKDVDALSLSFSKKLGKKVAFEISTDPALLAGVKVVVNGVTYDGSLRAQLSRLQARLVYGVGAASSI